MIQQDKVKSVLTSVDTLGGHCTLCSAECPVAVARRALQGLMYDLETAAAANSGDKENNKE